MKTKELNKIKEIIKNYYQSGYYRVDVIKEKEKFRIMCIEKNDNYLTDWNNEGLKIGKNFTIEQDTIREIKLESLLK